jgi:hypothetical protein
MTAQLSPAMFFQGIGPGGVVLVGGQLNTFAAGTSTPQATYTDSTQTTPNTNPVILNANGQASVWLDPKLSYKFLLNDSNGNFVGSQDNIAGLLSAPNVVIGPPASGTALTVNGATSGVGVPPLVVNDLNANTSGGAAIFVNSSVTPTLAIGVSNTANNGSSLSTYTLASDSTGNTASIALTNANWLSGAFGLANAPAGQNLFITSFNAGPICLATGGGVVIELTTQRGVLIQPPISGVALTIAGGGMQLTGTLNIAGNITINSTIAAVGPIGVNGASPPAQQTGWGTPTGVAVISNFPGASATLPQVTSVVAEIILALKNFGLFGA